MHLPRVSGKLCRKLVITVASKKTNQEARVREGGGFILLYPL